MKWHMIVPLSATKSEKKIVMFWISKLFKIIQIWKKKIENDVW